MRVLALFSGHWASRGVDIVIRSRRPVPQTSSRMLRHNVIEVRETMIMTSWHRCGPSIGWQGTSLGKGPSGSLSLNQPLISQGLSSLKIVQGPAQQLLKDHHSKRGHEQRPWQRCSLAAHGQRPVLSILSRPRIADQPGFSSGANQPAAFPS